MTPRSKAGNWTNGFEWSGRMVSMMMMNVSSEDIAVVCDDELFHARAAATGNRRTPCVG